MTILKIIETLQIYSEDFIAYKLDGGFANAVTEAVSLLIGQGEQIADLQNELRKTREAQRWIPVTERLPKHMGRYICNVRSFAFPGTFYQKEVVFDHGEWMGLNDITHWMPLPEPPKEEYNE